MKIAVAGAPATPRVAALIESMLVSARSEGHDVVRDASAARLVLNLTEASHPVAHWARRDAGQFAVSVVPLPGLREAGTAAPASEILSRTYPALLRTLSNAAIAASADGCALVTPELGVRHLEDDEALGAIVPLAGATFAIENEVSDDLPPSLAASPCIDDLRRGGARLSSLGLLPSPVKLDEILSPADLKLMRAVFGLQQISYGNLSVREPSGGFWMTGRGVDKSSLRGAGRDVLLVTGHDAERGLLRCRVPEGCGDARVSVDALEHALVYERFPSVAAIVHAHAWIDGVASTRQNWPCGTAELAQDVASLVADQPDPARAEIGLRNHGVTLCGESLEAIFERVEGRLRREIPAC